MKIIKRVAAVALAATMAVTALPATNAHASINYREKAEWNLYSSGGTTNIWQPLRLEYKNYFSHGAEAYYIRYANSYVKLIGNNVNLYDIAKGRYVNYYKLTPTDLHSAPFRPFNKLTQEISTSIFKVTIYSTDSTHYSEGCVGWY